jgi:hypothetical protein
MQWNVVELFKVVQVIIVSLQKGSQTPCAAAARVLRAFYSVPELLGGFLWRTAVLQNQGQQQSVVAVASDKEIHKLTNSVLI